jgi:hypothetical protein
MKHLTRTLRRGAAAAAIATAVTIAGATTTSAAPNDAETASSTLERICVGHGGSFHVNTYSGTNLICSAPRMLGDFAAERVQCDRANGAFSHTQIIDGRASWFCRITA